MNIWLPVCELHVHPEAPTRVSPLHETVQSGIHLPEESRGSGLRHFLGDATVPFATPEARPKRPWFADYDVSEFQKPSRAEPVPRSVASASHRGVEASSAELSRSVGPAEGGKGSRRGGESPAVCPWRWLQGWHWVSYPSATGPRTSQVASQGFRNIDNDRGPGLVRCFSFVLLIQCTMPSCPATAARYSARRPSAGKLALCLPGSGRLAQKPGSMKRGTGGL